MIGQMKQKNATHNAFAYLKGKNATNKIKQAFSIEKDTELAELFNIPKGTLATWQQRELTPYELIIRTSLMTGASLNALALNEGELFTHSQTAHNIIPLRVISILAGNWQVKDPISIDKCMLPTQPDNTNLALFITDHSRYIVNCNETEINQGKYIVEIDGKYSLNQVQRMPNHKVAILVAGSTLLLDSAQLNIIGKVVFSIRLE